MLSNAVKIFSFKVMSILLGLAITILLARFLGTEKFGIYATLIAILSIATIPLVQGFPTLIMRKSARLGADEIIISPRSIIRIADYIGAIWIAVFIAGMVGVKNQFQPLAGLSSSALVLGGLLFYLTLCANSRSAATWGKGHLLPGHFPDQIVRPLTHIFSLAIALTVTSELNISNALLAAVIGPMLALIAAIYIEKHIGRQEEGVAEVTLSGLLQVGRVLLPLSAISGMQMLNSQIDLVFMSVFAAAEHTGIYKLAVVLSSNVVLGVMIAQSLYSPKFAKLGASRKYSEIPKVYKDFSRVSVIVGALVLIGLGILALFAFERTFGEDFAPAKFLTLSLAAFQLLFLWAAGANTILVMLGEEAAVFKSILIAVLVKFLVAPPLILSLGFWGGAASSCIGLLVWRSLIWREYTRCLYQSKR